MQASRPKTGGRKPGSLNKTTAQVKAALLQAFEEVGGVRYLVQVAHDDPKTFCTLIGKVIPTEVAADLTSSDGSMSPVRIELVGVSSDDSED